MPVILQLLTSLLSIFLTTIWITNQMATKHKSKGMVILKLRSKEPIGYRLYQTF